MDVRRARYDAGVRCTAVACGRCAEACTRLDAILAVSLFLAAAICPFYGRALLRVCKQLLLEARGHLVLTALSQQGASVVTKLAAMLFGY